MKNPFIFILLLAVIFLSSFIQNKKDIPIGTWMNEEKEAKFEIFKSGDKLHGRITWLKEPLRNGKPKVDENNPQENLRNRPLIGLVFMKDFKPAGNNKWEDGTIYDPKNGKTYSCFMKVISNNKMEVKGYIGISLIGRSQTWTRVE